MGYVDCFGISKCTAVQITRRKIRTYLVFRFAGGLMATLCVCVGGRMGRVGKGEGGGC